MAVVLVILSAPYRAELSNDAVQAVSGAEQILAGNGYSTSILFFDEHFTTGRIPAPQTVWPPGQAAVSAALAVPTGSAEAGARLLPRLAYVALIPLVFLLALRIAGDWRLASVSALVQVGIVETWVYLTTPNSDLPFMVAVVATMLAVPALERPRGWLLASFLGAVSVGFRYAGLYLMIGLCILVLLDLWRNRAPGLRRLLPGIYALPGALLAGLLLLRNQLLVGNFQGGNTKGMTQPALGLAQATLASFADLIGAVRLSDLTSGSARALAAVAGLCGLLGLGAFALRGAIRRFASGVPQDASSRLGLQIAVVTTVYVAGVFWTATGSMISYGPRLLLPAVPLLLVLGLWLAQAGWPDWTPARTRTAAIALVLLLVLPQLFSAPRRWAARLHTLQVDTQAVDWVRSNTGPSDVLVAVGDAQHIGYLAQRPTVAVAPFRWTNRRWDETALRCAAIRYGARLLFVSRTLDPGDYPPFVIGLARGEAPPWMAPAMTFPDGLLYRIAPAKGAGSPCAAVS